MTVKLKNYSDKELQKIPPVTVEANQFSNPFGHFTYPLGVKLASRWAWIHWPEDMAYANGENASGEVDPFESMMHSLAVKRSGFHRADGPGGFALFPAVPNYQAGSESQRTLESDWESRCLAMHLAQHTITVEAKSTDKTNQPTRIVSDLDRKTEVPKFEDSEMATTFNPWALTQRGD